MSDSWHSTLCRISSATHDTAAPRYVAGGGRSHSASPPGPLDFTTSSSCEACDALWGSAWRSSICRPASTRNTTSSRDGFSYATSSSSSSSTSHGIAPA
eukprot:CAMPEP_0183811882 /NCGR_PEP_ID=MMETSP0803_2-20130417/50181_1 /TAXON_ID=195967 /ORGANISM="Crustomastix stigmata, Strain CCMP3273" /LENGTH=98 /DNA_ID=CAMNT_0026056719 /DNA_START=158 /DNA_END=450 /DNA_ORIENTATION=+